MCCISNQFCCSNIQTIRDFTECADLPADLHPGIIREGIRKKTKCQSSYVLSVDGKKLESGMTVKHGDEDLFGYEDDETQHEQLPFAMYTYSVDHPQVWMGYSFRGIQKSC